MRWIALVSFCVFLTAALADPDPKKFKPGVKDSPAVAAKLTDEERKFLREVETKFGIKSDVPVEKKESELEPKHNKTEEIEDNPVIKPPFPGVIAIEIVNDTETTDTKTKGKRTIDANLGYGYRTNNGYQYTYFGKSGEDKGKYMIYPYSQHDIPPASSSSSHSSSSASVVEIQPSQAYELVPVKEQEQQTSYEYKKPQIDFRDKYEKVQGLQSPPPPYPETQTSHNPSTLYATYNGEHFSSLQGQFPKVMSNYYVDPSQLLQNPQYQSAGYTQQYLRSHGATEQRVVPVLVLRIPSSYLKNPSAELYANLPQSSPMSSYLNNVNLQELVNNYFKKIGYSMPPQIMSYQSSDLGKEHAVVASPTVSYQPQHYAHPYVRPSYTHSDYSGVQYSAVQPVMAKYPASAYYKQQYYMTHAASQPLYSQPLNQHNYEYRYQYIPQTAAKTQNYYVQQQYSSPHASAYADAGKTSEESAHDTATSAEYGVPQRSNHEAPATSVVYEHPKSPSASQPTLAQQYEEVESSAPEYESQKTTYAQYGAPDEEKTQYSAAGLAQSAAAALSAQYATAQSTASHYPSGNIETQAYYTQQKDTASSYPSYPQAVQKYFINPQSSEGTQTYIYQQQVNDDSASKTIVISENYPSKDHTHAHASSPASSYEAKTPTKTQQSVNYVTPMPYSAAKYQSQYRVMSPQTVINKLNDKVTYVNSHSLPMHYLSLNTGETYNPEEEYTVSHAAPVGSQKPASYPKNYHSQKRMVNKNDKPESSKISKKEPEMKSTKVDTKKTS